MNAKHLACSVLVLVLASAYPAAAHAGFFDVGVTVGFAPPPLVVYAQPPCPSPGYLWAPGYWAYADDGYYWVPGTWVYPPRFGLLWTPGYWSDEDDYFAWHPGYWGPHVGFYGGINYGFGYFGAGFVGGYWRDHEFFYNRAVTNVTQVNITNVYRSNVYNSRIINGSVAGARASYNGGDGVRARPTRTEIAASHEPRYGLTPPQRRQVEGARTIPDLRASVNRGLPPVAATNRPGAFAGRGVVAARGASARSLSAGATIGPRRAVADSRQFSGPHDIMVGRPVHPVTTSTHISAAPHIAAAPQASRARQPITYDRNSVAPSRLAAPQASSSRADFPSAYRGNPPSARSFSAPPDRRWAESRVPHENVMSGANSRPARDAQSAHGNVPAAPRR